MTAIPAGWFKLGAFAIPMPPKDLLTALVIVLLFLPVVIISSRLMRAILPRASAKAKKD